MKLNNTAIANIRRYEAENARAARAAIKTLRLAIRVCETLVQGTRTRSYIEELYTMYPAQYIERLNCGAVVLKPRSPSNVMESALAQAKRMLKEEVAK